MINDKIALFDFCETLANFQTADAYVRYVMRVHSREIKKGLNYWLQILMEKSKLSAVLFRLGSNVNKFMLLSNLKGLSVSMLEQSAKSYYDEVIKPNLIKETVAELKKCQDEGYYCAIVSGGYDIYLNFFAEEFRTDMLLCSQLKFHHGLFSGKLEGKDCMAEEKVNRLRKVFSVNDMKGMDSVSYSDSESDLPFLNFTKRAVVVKKKAPQWAIKRKFEILLWQK